MRRTARPAPRGGFTLVELLVVISIMALLAALVVGGIRQVRTGQLSKASEQTLTKLQLNLNAQWKAVADEVRAVRSDNVPAELVTIAGGDKERARSLYAYAKLRQEFPETFDEARNGFTLTGKDAAGITVTWPPTGPLRPLKTFAAIPAGPTTLSMEEQGAALLYLIVAEKGKGGVTIAADDVTQGAQGKIGPFTVFKDAWGTPITFIRTANADNLPSLAEIDAPPYVAKANQPCRDPFDLAFSTMTEGRLKYDDGAATGSWRSNRDDATNGVLVRLNASANRSKIKFDARNKVITVVSAGPDKLYWPPQADADEQDNLYGHRLLRQGNKGD